MMNQTTTNYEAMAHEIVALQRELERSGDIPMEQHWTTRETIVADLQDSWPMEAQVFGLDPEDTEAQTMLQDAVVHEAICETCMAACEAWVEAGVDPATDPCRHCPGCPYEG